MTEASATLMHASFVSRESVRIAMILAALNNLEIKVSDIKNAYLTAPVSENIWTVLGPEFGTDTGKRAVIVRALYSLKSVGASFRNHLGYESCIVDPDLWFKAMTRPSDEFQYFAYLLLYVDNILAIHHDGESAIKEIGRFFKMKPGSVGYPDIYLGAKLQNIELKNGVVAWSLSPSKYVKEASNNVKDHFKK